MRFLTRRSIAIIYALGLVWFVALFGTALVLTQPMLQVYEAMGIESAVVHVVATVSLAVAMATAVTLGVGLALRSTVEHEEAAERA